MNEKYLPVGSVVTLKEATKKVMIIGYFPMSKEGEVFDYNACTYPEGVLDPKQTLAFNHDKIGQIDQIGFINEEYNNYNNNLKELVKNLQNIKDINIPS